MSCLSLPVDDLIRLQVTIRLTPSTNGSSSFSLQAVPRTDSTPQSSSLNPSHHLASSYAVTFQSDQDEQGSILRIFSSVTSESQPAKLQQDENQSGYFSDASLSPPSEAESVPEANAHSLEDPLPVKSQQPFPTFSLDDDSIMGNSEFLPSSWALDAMQPFSSDSLSSYFDPSYTGPFETSSLLGEKPFDTQRSTILDQNDLSIPSSLDMSNEFSLFDFSSLSTSPPTSGSSSEFSFTSSASSASSDFWQPPPLSVTPSPESNFISLVPKQSRSSSASSTRESSPSNYSDDSHRRFRCEKPDCKRRFTSQHTLKLHMEAHKPKARPQFPCTLGCSEKFSRQHDRLRHEVAQHGKVCEWLCDECGRFFSSKKTLGIHKCPATRGEPRWVK